jgi:hypothetical protein
MSFRGGRDWDNHDRRYGNSGNSRGQVRRREDDELGWELANKRRRYDVQTILGHHPCYAHSIRRTMNRTMNIIMISMPRAKKAGGVSAGLTGTTGEKVEMWIKMTGKCGTTQWKKTPTTTSDSTGTRAKGSLQVSRVNMLSSSDWIPTSWSQMYVRTPPLAPSLTQPFPPSFSVSSSPSASLQTQSP